jgi:hypothetical protein
MENSLLFNGSPDHGDDDYLMWLQQHPHGFVANIPHLHTPYDFLPVVIHQASCPDAQRCGSDGKLTSNTRISRQML